jgi:hypothetical protein
MGTLAYRPDGPFHALELEREFIAAGHELSPLNLPLASFSRGPRVFGPGDSPFDGGLPGLIADSLPDSTRAAARSNLRSGKWPRTPAFEYRMRVSCTTANGVTLPARVLIATYGRQNEKPLAGQAQGIVHSILGRVFEN